MRDYTVGLHFRQHCLTWSLAYRQATNRIGVGVNLTDFMFGGRPRPQRAPKGTLGPWSAVAGQPLQREGLERLPPAAVAPDEPVVAIPTEFTLGRDQQQRAPDGAAALRLRPPPSLRVALAATLQ